MHLRLVPGAATATFHQWPSRQHHRVQAQPAACLPRLTMASPRLERLNPRGRIATDIPLLLCRVFPLAMVLRQILMAAILVVLLFLQWPRTARLLRNRGTALTALLTSTAPECPGPDNPAKATSRLYPGSRNTCTLAMILTFPEPRLARPGTRCPSELKRTAPEFNGSGCTSTQEVLAAAWPSSLHSQYTHDKGPPLLAATRCVLMPPLQTHELSLQPLAQLLFLRRQTL